MAKDELEQDNDTWQPISLAAGRVLVKLSEEKQTDGERDAQRTRDDKKRNEDQRAYIEQRLREIAAFEQRLRPGYRSRRKRN